MHYGVSLALYEASVWWYVPEDTDLRIHHALFLFPIDFYFLVSLSFVTVLVYCLGTSSQTVQLLS
jgi:hypothetical protein